MTTPASISHLRELRQAHLANTSTIGVGSDQSPDEYEQECVRVMPELLDALEEAQRDSKEWEHAALDYLDVVAERDQAIADLAAERDRFEREMKNVCCAARIETQKVKEAEDRAERAEQNSFDTTAALKQECAEHNATKGALAQWKERARMANDAAIRQEEGKNAARAQAKEMAGLLREIRQYMHSDHVSDSMLVRFTRVHLTRIDATLAAYDKEIK